ncbi:hypothetical protein A2130_02035 [Candidatus Woesebacteria bacterium GWC2_33_12]|uniref:Uncharacterized protein n=1 Tax=Candidatus Woesebacteria bacterium GW2011_GWB1_33_22 TaxID=1618566 RepID=A0A0G0CNM9_9BACT|nr:MAG: hypothetical protein UR29_C0003G0040 [Candidatus Woesebacteria bacterium GW2011_GWC2_33_12]KKP42281.1 MAG: hypothetical protein UR33_C0004G0040 [Candidatus Woesebacteria bacterium GW2011_GWA2_33_20]KKP45012.1 MAG: hypothetical protein UR35_C0004G0044 [Candidatus Woesebacteria bacterium GW2011_GWB1_33_22]KKP46861.1 MAG: hypothetical protein UR37_C0004G0040 [Microgenomates group bacterium GW2011_GWC1_33_28]KKP50733.1 MAG: hypothetical protein UR41_C0004G0044 [Candidatus Woesebacteria bact
MTEINNENKEWKIVGTFGKGYILAKDRKRKIIEPGKPTFEYEIDPEKYLQEKTPLNDLKKVD